MNLGTDWVGLPAHPSGPRPLTCNSAFPGLPNCYRCMAKTDETTEQAGDTLSYFFKKAQDYQHTNTSTGSSISTLYFQLEGGSRKQASWLQAMVFLMVFPVILPSTE